ncbi:FkbM family methyltransferase (plasmid) [Phyllobacterium sp. A18/5-2]|uniref:FkbM family methyltransferase n=1 Tax=Phyllobacterium sp. A18/5-2 TaxID=2978392 RepID=UPI0021C728AF|nr:FkbM family methyltransferase [Phyllobacterium sp. A18/5-2]UXN66274.1 FkbM family methyltransferase [Phyllobacterium sp. A18/5-2]
MPGFIDHTSNLVRSLGWVKTAGIFFRRALKINAATKVGPHKLQLRCRDSDLFVYGQVFGAEEYSVGKRNERALKDFIARSVGGGKTPIIIDGGGNVGYSAVYFATTYPEAQVITIEPDPVTFALMKSNCSAFKNVVPIHGAIWTHQNGVHLGNTAQASWARTVEDEGKTPSFTIEALVSKIPNADPLILKLDIEGAEAEVLRSSAAVVRRFPCILIEPHDFMVPGKNTISGLFSTLADRQIDTLIRGENLMFFDTQVLRIGLIA